MELAASRVICIGGAAVDRKYRALSSLRSATSNPVASERSFGGVARNVAENMARLGAQVSLVSILGDDENGREMLDDLKRLGIDTRHMASSETHSTAEYVAVLQPDGELAMGLADMAIFDEFGPALLQRMESDFGSGWIFADCNLPAETLHHIVDLSRRKPLTLAIDAVSTPKVMRLAADLSGIGLLLLNLDEARAFLDQSDASPEAAAAALLERGAERIVLTLGDKGLVAADGAGIRRIGSLSAQIVDATGAGDALIAATLVGLMGGHDLHEAARLGTAAAALTVESGASVRPDLSLALLETTLSLRAAG